MWSLVRGSSAASRLVTVMSAMAALSLVAMIFIIADMVRTVASGANQLDVSKTSQSVEAALSGRRGRALPEVVAGQFPHRAPSA